MAARVTAHWKPLVTAWFDFYQQHYGSDPLFNGPAQRSLKSIVKELERRAVTKGLLWDEVTAVATLTKFLTVAHSDKWLRCNFQLNIIYGKFDTIIAIARGAAASAPKLTIEQLHAALRATG